MTIKQTVTFDEEILKIMVDMTGTGKKIRKLQLALSIPAVVLLSVGYARFLRVGNGAGTTLMMLGVFIGIVINILYPRLVYSSLQRMNASSIGKKVNYTITDYEIFMSSEFGDVKMSWDDCEKVHEVGKYLVLTMNNKATVMLNKKELSDEEITWLKEHRK